MKTLTRHERILVLRVAATCAISTLLVAAVPTGYLYMSNHDRIAENQKISEELARFTYRQCVEAEVRDVVYADWGGALLTISRRLDPTDNDVQHLITVLEDGINALEPRNEQDCVPPLDGGQG